jgi:hypothetical protein
MPGGGDGIIAVRSRRSASAGHRRPDSAGQWADLRTIATIVAWLALIAVVAVAMVYAQLRLRPGVKVLINLISAEVLVASGYAWATGFLLEALLTVGVVVVGTILVGLFAAKRAG